MNYVDVFLDARPSELDCAFPAYTERCGLLDFPYNFKAATNIYFEKVSDNNCPFFHSCFDDASV